MSTPISPDTINFLADLKENNYREWFQENKDRHTSSIDNFKQLLLKLIAGINEFDKNFGFVEPADCIFRIYRDVRFSPNKQPYKTNLGAYIAPGGRKSTLAGYYIHIEPNASFLSGGIYMAPNETMKTIREELFDNQDEFLEITQAEPFKKMFAWDTSEVLKRTPRGFQANSKVDEYLRMKHLTPIHPVNNDILLSNNILEYSLNVYRELYPLINFINKAIR